jgi:S-adenosyl methyltransferase
MTSDNAEAPADGGTIEKAGTDFVQPGLVSVEEWRPDPDAVDEGKSSIYGAVGRKRETGRSLPRDSQDLTNSGCHNRLADGGGRGVAQVD